MSGPSNHDWTRPYQGQSRESAWWETPPQQPPTWHPTAQPHSPPYQPPPATYPPTYPRGQYYQQPSPYYPSYPPPSAYPSYPPPSAPPSQPSKGSKVWVLIGGVAMLGLIGAAVLLLLVVKPSFLNGKVLDVKKAQAGVQQILTDPTNGYGMENISNVRCNNGKNPTAKKGASFTCEVNVDGKIRKVKVVFSDDNGTYEVDRPR